MFQKYKSEMNKQKNGNREANEPDAFEINNLLKPREIL
jgi:hypothetical protein